MMIKRVALFGLAVLINLLILLVIFYDGSESAKNESGNVRDKEQVDSGKPKNGQEKERDLATLPKKEQGFAAPEGHKPDRQKGRGAAAVSRIKKAPASGRRSARNNLKRAYNYRKAVNGNIKKLPSSKLATTGLLVDIDSREVLWQKNPRKAVPIASMTKMMTALLVFEKLAQNNDLAMDTKIKVTKSAYKIGGSQVWLDPRETFSLNDLMKAIMIKSANDAAYLVAEYLGKGNVKSFVKAMNNRARALKMPNTIFYNPHGLPEGAKRRENSSCPEGMSILAEYLLEYPVAVKMASTRLDYIRKGSKTPTMLSNHNKLVASCKGVNGMKTGYTDKAKYCITATCNRNGRRLVAVVTGFPSGKARNKFVSKLFDWGYSR